MNLEKYLEVAGKTQQEFADLVGVAQARISQLIRGALPSLPLAQRIERVTDGEVPVSAWTPVEKKRKKAA
jgi:DNA-binding transcriptional regulator YdaS (Cro superfamily)